MSKPRAARLHSVAPTGGLIALHVRELTSVIFRMIIDGSRLVVTDNSGAKEVECIKTRGRYASIGDIITCSVKKAIRGKVTQVCTCVMHRIGRSYRCRIRRRHRRRRRRRRRHCFCRHFC